ncbi:MAG: hypothetical protein JWQ72_794 [Polaromonas sp.]|nr:hypothetical protein [Polaromonas sp.]
MPDLLTSRFLSGDAFRSRNVSPVVRSAVLDVPAPPVHLAADWEREVSLQLNLAPGDVEALSLPRARMRWPDYRQCVQVMAGWMNDLGLPGVLAGSDVALMACRGARYHHDGMHYGGAAFCNLFMSEDKGLDVHFPITGHRIPLTRGTALLFDTCQPHAVVPRGSSRFDAADFGSGVDCTQVFLTWELPIEDARVARQLEVAFDTCPLPASQAPGDEVWLNGEPAVVRPESGLWCRAE